MSIKTRVDKLEAVTGETTRVIVIQGADREAATAKWLKDNGFKTLPRGHLVYLTINGK